MTSKRIFRLNRYETAEGSESVLYLMSRDQRFQDNWALIFAQEYALKHNAYFSVAFCLTNSFLNASSFHFSFMIEGLKQVFKDCLSHNIPFFLLIGNPEFEIPMFITQNKISILFFDFDPLKIKVRWQQSIINQISIPAYEVDAHNIVPCRICSIKQEYAAYTIRPKIQRLIPEFLDEFPNIIQHPVYNPQFLQHSKNITQDNFKYLNNLYSTESISNKYFTSGESPAKRVLTEFISNKIDSYAENKNKPELNAVSGLSPYLHFGQISAQRVALEVINSNAEKSAKSVFLEELVIRRELADNFCFYNKNYDNFEGFPDWAKKTLNEHINDKRSYLYSFKQLENAETHDNLWNYAQKNMVIGGKMHGYLRMYWAKKILEWSESPQIAMEIACKLNDMYELDGRDPNGYAGIAWSIGGVHDRAWSERPIFGKIRFMSYNSQIKKINFKALINQK